MEKVTIKSAKDSGKKAGNGNPIIDVELEDGKTGAGFDLKLLDLVGQEVELDIKANKEYKGVMQYYFSLPKNGQSKGGSKFPQKDWTFEKKKHALDMSVRMFEPGEDVSSVLKRADQFVEWLTKNN